jgi:hypothetical protein
MLKTGAFTKEDLTEEQLFVASLVLVVFYVSFCGCLGLQLTPLMGIRFSPMLLSLLQM